MMRLFVAWIAGMLAGLDVGAAVRDYDRVDIFIWHAHNAAAGGFVVIALWLIFGPRK